MDEMESWHRQSIITFPGGLPFRNFCGIPFENDICGPASLSPPRQKLHMMLDVDAGKNPYAVIMPTLILQKMPSAIHLNFEQTPLILFIYCLDASTLEFVSFLGSCFSFAQCTALGAVFINHSRLTSFTFWGLN